MRILLVGSEKDPLALAVMERWGTPPSLGWHVDGTPIRQLTPHIGVLRRSVLSLHDERLDQRLPTPLQKAGTTLLFLSVHRSERGPTSLTVHPIGNPDADTTFGGRPEWLVPTDPPLMAQLLRRLHEVGSSWGIPASFEATHHGPEVAMPAAFVEWGGSFSPRPPTPEIAQGLADLLVTLLPEDSTDRVAVGIGGGHYAPHFSDLVWKRHWAFGHIFSHHRLLPLHADMLRRALELTPKGEGFLFARAKDRSHPTWIAIGPLLQETMAPRRALDTTTDAKLFSR